MEGEREVGGEGEGHRLGEGETNRNERESERASRQI
jgi:hypothetical protein